MLTDRRKRTLRYVLLGILAVVVCEQTWRHSHEYLFAEEFATVVPGKIYRGAWQRPWPMRRVIDNYHIKTVVALAHPDDHPFSISEKTICEQKGVKWVHIPIADARKPSDPSVSDLVEQAAAAIADPANQPVYFHCHHGINRASMAQMAYRMLYCGWTLEQSEKEIADTFGLKEVNHGPDYRHMRSFYAERVLPRRKPAESPTPTTTADSGHRTPTR
jgi:protein-tyrosine phosphatase